MKKVWLFIKKIESHTILFWINFRWNLSVVYNEEQKKIKRTDKQQKRIRQKKDPITQNNWKCIKLIAGETNMRTFSNLHLSVESSVLESLCIVFDERGVTRYPTLSSHLFKNKMSSIFGHFFFSKPPVRGLWCVSAFLPRVTSFHFS